MQQFLSSFVTFMWLQAVEFQLLLFTERYMTEAVNTKICFLHPTCFCIDIVYSIRLAYTVTINKFQDLVLSEIAVDVGLEKGHSEQHRGCFH